MSEVVTIENVARLEGHASVSLYLDDIGGIDKAEFSATEPSRAFDVILRGKHASEVPRLAARICGICYTAHNIGACKALEDAWGTPVPESAKKIREMLLYANTLSSNALHTFFLAAPGLLIDGINTIADLKDNYPQIFHAGMELRDIGQKISEIIAGRKVHTTVSVPGGVRGTLCQEKQDQIMELLESATSSIETMEYFFHYILCTKQDYMQNFGKIKTHFVSLKQSDRLELYDAPIEILMSDGKVKHLSPAEFLDGVVELEKDYSYVRHPYLKNQGPEKGQFRVGPLARIQNADWQGTMMKSFRNNFGPSPVQATMGYDVARVPEMFECIKSMRDILDSGLDNDIKNVATPKDARGVAVLEAPRGILLHCYETNSSGIVKDARVIAPTTFHQGSIEQSAYEAAKSVFNGEHNDCTIDENKVKVEQVIRAYDPCMSCAGATQLRVIKKSD